MIIIFGAGIIGLFTGYELLKSGKKVKIIDARGVKGDATNASVGMLAPLIEAKPQETEIFNLMYESKKTWEKIFTNKQTRLSIGFRNNSALMVALNKDDEEKLKFKKNFFQKIGFETKLLNNVQTLKIEPSLNSNVTSSLLCKNQDQVNPISLKNFLINQIKDMGGEILKTDQINSFSLKKNKVFFNNESYDFEKIIISCGAWSNEILKNSFGIDLPLRPLKGVSLLVQSMKNKFIHNLWFRNIYIAPRREGILAIGATEEEKGFDSSIRIDELYSLTKSIWESFPNIEDFELKDIKVGLRPTLIDGSPVIGPIKKISDDVILSFGHYRHGILLAPITANIICKYIFEKDLPEPFKFFSPDRFNL